MFLSNTNRAVFALAALAAVVNCSWFTAQPGNNTNSAVVKPESTLPFQIREPLVFQADFVTTTGETSTRTHYARNGNFWRVDTFEGDKPRRSIIVAEKTFYLDHPAKTVFEPPRGALADPSEQYIKDLMDELLSPPERSGYEELASDGPIRKFRVTTPGAKDAATIHFDPALGMIVRHEIGDPPSFVIELRDLTLEVSDDAFKAPGDYRRKGESKK